MEILEWLGKYWLEWLCGLVATGALFFAKHYIKIQRQVNEEKWKDKEKNMCGKIITTLEDRIQGVEDKSATEDVIIHKELDEIHSEVDTVESGILSIQGKQFRDMCEVLLQQDHISVDEYQEFEEEYSVYKKLGGNHRGDALHERVVAKFDKQSSKKESE